MIWIGTSGYNYPEWKGTFYPADLPASKMLAFYSARFPTVEINYTFYRLPTEKLVAGWAAGTPSPYKLTLKAPKRITHDKRLRDVGELLRVFCHTAGTLGDKLGVLLFQLAPNFKIDLAVFDAFLADLPPGARAAFEFRHPSWFDEEVYERLRARNLALCIADSEKLSTPVVATADYGYFRLRDEGYEDADIGRWADTIRAHQAQWNDTFVYFKHEEAGQGPEFARRLIERLARADAKCRLPTADVRKCSSAKSGAAVLTCARQHPDPLGTFAICNRHVGTSARLLRTRRSTRPNSPVDAPRWLLTRTRNGRRAAHHRRDVRVAGTAGSEKGSGGTNGSSAALMIKRRHLNPIDDAE